MSSRKKFCGRNIEISEEANETVVFPAWVENLLEYFEVIGKESREVKDGAKSRPRDYYKLQCSLCKQDANSDKSAAEKGTQPKQSSKTKDVVGIIVSNGAFGFLRHLERTHKDVDMIALNKKLTGGLKRKTTEKDEECNENIIGSIIRKPAIKGNLASAESVAKYDKKGPKQKLFELQVLDFIVTDGLPFECVEKPGFRQFVQSIDPRVTCPSRRSIGRLLQSKETQILNHIKSMVKGLHFASAHLMLDIWSSRQKLAVIGVQIRFIKDWKIRQCVIGFKHFPGSHDGSSIKTKVQDLLETFDLTMLDFMTVTADNASAILLAFRDLSNMIVNDSQRVDLAANRENEGSRVANVEIAEEEEGDGIDNDNIDIELLDVDEITRDFVSNEEIETTIDAVINDWISSTVLNLRRNSCLAHLLQLAIKDALVNPEVASVVKKVNNIVTWFHKSNKQYTALRDLSVVGLVKPCETRWNSTYHCLERICKIVQVNDENARQVSMAKLVNEVLHKAKTTSKQKIKVPPGLTDEDIACIHVILKVLEPFAQLTDIWQGDSVTSSLVILGLIDALEDLDNVNIDSLLDQAVELEDFKTAMKTSVVKRFTTKFGSRSDDSSEHRGRRVVTTDIFNDEFYLLATVLDPRSKTIPFESDCVPEMTLENGFPTKPQVVKLLQLAFDEEKKRELAEKDNIQIVSSGSEDPISQKKSREENAASGMAYESVGPCGQTLTTDSGTSRLTSTSTKIKSKNKQNRNVFARVRKHQIAKATKESCNDEIESYLSSSVIHNGEDPLKFWRLNEERYPILSNLARKFLAMPATSASVERLFSVAGSIISARRARMKIETAERIILYNDNLNQGF